MACLHVVSFSGLVCLLLGCRCCASAKFWWWMMSSSSVDHRINTSDHVGNGSPSSCYFVIRIPKQGNSRWLFQLCMTTVVPGRQNSWVVGRLWCRWSWPLWCPSSKAVERQMNVLVSLAILVCGCQESEVLLHAVLVLRWKCSIWVILWSLVPWSLASILCNGFELSGLDLFAVIFVQGLQSFQWNSYTRYGD